MRRSPRSAPGRLGRGAVVALAVVALGAALAGCGGDGSDDEPDRRVEIYGLMLDWLLERQQFPVDEDETETETVPTVFVDHLNRGIDLDAQVGLVARFEDRFDLRFVDSLQEAVEVDEPRSPVRGGAVLIGLGSIPDTSPFLVRGEVYRNSRDIEAYRFEAVRWGGDWVLRDEPEPVDPEGFVPGG